MRQLSNALLGELYASESSDPFLMLMTLTHASFSTIYLVNNIVDVTSNGNLHIAFPMEITIPADDGQSSREASIVFDNVSLDIIEQMRSVSTPMLAKIEMVLASDPDNVEISFEELKVSNITYDAQTIKASLFLDDFLNTELTSEKYTPTIYPGLFS